MAWLDHKTLGNRNIPKGALVYGTLVGMSGEIKTTYYALQHNPPHPKYGKWSLWKVSDWVWDKPQPTTYEEIRLVAGKDVKPMGIEL